MPSSVRTEANHEGFESGVYMARRTPYTKVEKVAQKRPAHVRGMGDVVFKGFQCLNGDCQEFIIIREDEIGADFEIVCPACEFVHKAGGETKFFDYRLVHRQEGKVIEEGEFVILHDDYVGEAQRLKYCLLCYARKPLRLFDIHNSRQSGRQGECRLCKTIYNGIKNQSRVTDQHREAAERRRLFKRLAGETGRIDSKSIFEKFGGRCFKCNRELRYMAAGQKQFNLDHTLPARLLWPLSTDNATLLCSACNNEKHDRWPSDFYSPPELRTLARLTGYGYALLSGPPAINDDAVRKIIDDPDAFIEEWIPYPDAIRRVRGVILKYAEIDIFEEAVYVPGYLWESDERAE